MRPLRSRLCAAAALAIVASTPLSAVAANSVSGEVSGNSAAARVAVDSLRDDWATAVASGGYTAPDPMVLTSTSGSVVSGVIGTTSVGTTVSVERSRYSASPTAPVFVSASPNPGTAACTNSGLSMQGSSPRPASLVGNSSCSNGNGTVYTESGGTGESTTRDAVTFTFSRPVWGFGGWFGDLETRTDGLGVPAVVRLLDDTGATLDEFQVEPVGTVQTDCSNAVSGCGNNSSRWVGFTGVLASAMVVIVGDEDATGTSLGEGMGFIGPNAVDAVPQLQLAIGTSAIGPVTGDTIVQVPVTVSNPGDVPVGSLAGVDCAGATVLPGASRACTVRHLVTQAELDAGGFTLTATVRGDWTGLAASATDTGRVPLVASTGFTVSLIADTTDFDTIGTVIGYTATVTNTGNQTNAPDAVTLDDVPLTCTPTGPVPPAATITCTGTLTTTTGADVTRTATVAWDTTTADSNPVTVTWTPTRAFTVSLTADTTDFDTIGTVIGYTATVTNTGNQTNAPDAVTLDDVPLTCTPTGPVPPAATITCTGTLTTTTGADVTRTATVAWDTTTADSNPVTVTWTPTPGTGSSGTTDSPELGAPSAGAGAPTGLAATGLTSGGLGLVGVVLVGLGLLFSALATRILPQPPRA